jgi:hypothetical protein
MPSLSAAVPLRGDHGIAPAVPPSGRCEPLAPVIRDACHGREGRPAHPRAARLLSHGSSNATAPASMRRGRLGAAGPGSRRSSTAGADRVSVSVPRSHKGIVRRAASRSAACRFAEPRPRRGLRPARRGRAREGDSDGAPLSRRERSLRRDPRARTLGHADIGPRVAGEDAARRVWASEQSRLRRMQWTNS